jgi:lipid A 3-O-deacylase
MTAMWRIFAVAGLLWLCAGLIGGAAAQEGAVPRDVLASIATAGSAANQAEMDPATQLFERRAAATRLRAQVISAIASHPGNAVEILRTAYAAAPRHRDYVANGVGDAFPGYRALALREAGTVRPQPRLIRASASETVASEIPREAAARPSETPMHREFGLSAIVLGAGGHDVGVFGHRKESGADTNFELRFTPFGGWLWELLQSPEPHIGVHYNTDGNTNQFFAGGTWMFDLGWGIFAGGSLGFALHDGETDTDKLDRKELGLPVLFRESAEIGFRLDHHHGFSLYLDHISNAGIDENNEGLDTFGLRYTYRI